MIPQQHQRQSEFTDAAQFIKVLKIIFFAMLPGQVVFMVISVVLSAGKKAETIKTGGMLARTSTSNAETS
jgi:hypothetical protein